MLGNLIKVLRLGDKRRDRRVPIRLSATVGAAKGRVTDLSLGGCGFYPDRPGLEVGASTVMSMNVEDGILLTLPVEIRSADDEGMVYSLAFTELDDTAFSIIEDILSTQKRRAKQGQTPRLPVPKNLPRMTRPIPARAALTASAR